MRARLLLVLIVFELAAAMSDTKAETARLFDVIGRSDLGGRGMNAGLAIAGDCGYIGSRSGTQGTLILDLSDPRTPTVTGEIPHHANSTMRELRADPALNLLVVLNYRLDPNGGSPNNLDLYDISDCRAPVWQGTIDFGPDMPHEFFLWTDPDPAHRGRVLAFVTMWGHAPNLRVVDLSDPSRPALVATWDAAPETGRLSRIHSLTVSRDGRRAFIADWDAGLMVLDTSGLARGSGDLTPALLTSPSSWLMLPGGNLHSAVIEPDGRFVITTQEIYGPGTCPYGRVHLVDVENPAEPALISDFAIPENDPADCAATERLDGAFTTHNPMIVDGIAFVSWYAGGLRAIDLRDPTQPKAAGAFVPDPLPSVAADDLSLGSYPVRMWSSPIVRDGLIYVVDIRNGLFILRYTGPNADKIGQVAFAEGNSTIGRN